MKNFLIETYYFCLKNISASIFGILLLMLVAFVKLTGFGFESGFDTIFVGAVVIQIGLLVFGLETKREFLVVFVFHILATVMELFKTHPSIGSWVYPGSEQALFAIASVPLFVGFMYSAVGSYITRATKVLMLEYLQYPKTTYTVFLAVAIYLNFFTHHFIVDFRYVLFVLIVVLFWNTKVRFCVYQRARKWPFLLTGFLTACLVWLAENFATYFALWLYPNQMDAWHMVSIHKIGSWFLLLIMSFVIVKTLHLGNNADNE